MQPTLPDVDPAEAMLAELAGLDLSLARHVHACAVNTDDPKEVAELAKAYQRIARSLRFSLALHGKLKRERLRDEREAQSPSSPPPRDGARIRERQDELGAALRRVIWAEHEHDETPDYAAGSFRILDQRLEILGRDPAFGLVAPDGSPGDDTDRAWTALPLDDHVVALCRGLALPEAAARAWRELPDPPARLGGAGAQPAPEPERRSSA